MASECWKFSDGVQGGASLSGLYMCCMFCLCPGTVSSLCSGFPNALNKNAPYNRHNIIRTQPERVRGRWDKSYGCQQQVWPCGSRNDDMAQCLMHFNNVHIFCSPYLGSVTQNSGLWVQTVFMEPAIFYCFFH